MGLSAEQQAFWGGVATTLFDAFEVEADEVYTAPGEAAGVGDPAPAGATYPVRVARSSTTRSRLDNEAVQPGSIETMTILQSELAVAPELEGTITFANGDVYLIIDVDQDAANATWQLTGRLL